MIYIGSSGQCIRCDQILRLSPIRKHQLEIRATALSWSCICNSGQSLRTSSSPIAKTSSTWCSTIELGCTLGSRSLLILIGCRLGGEAYLWNVILLFMCLFCPSGYLIGTMVWKVNLLVADLENLRVLESVNKSPLNPPKDLKILRTTSSRKDKN